MLMPPLCRSTAPATNTIGLIHPCIREVFTRIFDLLPCHSIKVVTLECEYPVLRDVVNNALMLLAPNSLNSLEGLERAPMYSTNVKISTKTLEEVARNMGILLRKGASLNSTFYFSHLASQPIPENWLPPTVELSPEDMEFIQQMLTALFRNKIGPNRTPASNVELITLSSKSLDYICQAIKTITGKSPHRFNKVVLIFDSSLLLELAQAIGQPYRPSKYPITLQVSISDLVHQPLPPWFFDDTENEAPDQNQYPRGQKHPFFEEDRQVGQAFPRIGIIS